MREKIHICNKADPIVEHGQDQLSICGSLIKKARPLVIVPDVTRVSVGIIADTFGRNMCGKCQMIEPELEYVYFLVAESEWLRMMRHQPEYAEVG